MSNKLVERMQLEEASRFEHISIPSRMYIHLTASFFVNTKLEIVTDSDYI